jgi:hypothetical protein
MGTLVLKTDSAAGGEEAANGTLAIKSGSAAASQEIDAIYENVVAQVGATPTDDGTLVLARPELDI